MPELPAPSGQWPELADCVGRLALNPDQLEDYSEGIQKAFHCALLYSVLKAGLMDPQNLKPDDFDVLATARADEIPLGQRISDIIYGGLTAGHILVYVLRMSIHHTNVASVESAVKILVHRYGTEGRKNSPRSIKAAWSKYKPLGPFIAAIHQLEESDVLGIERLKDLINVRDQTGEIVSLNTLMLQNIFEDYENVWPPLEEGLQVFVPKVMAYAEKLRLAGEQFFASGQEARRRPLLDPSKMWSVPSTFELPDVKLKLPPLSYDELNAVTGK